MKDFEKTFGQLIRGSVWCQNKNCEACPGETYMHLHGIVKCESERMRIIKVFGLAMRSLDKKGVVINIQKEDVND